MGAIKTLCRNAILIDKGRLIRTGAAGEVVQQYLSEQSDCKISDRGIWINPVIADYSNQVILRSVKLIDPEDNTKSSFSIEEYIRVRINYEINKEIKGLRIIAQFITSDDTVAFTSLDDSATMKNKIIPAGSYEIDCVIPPLLLNIDTYSIVISLDVPKVISYVPPTRTVSLRTIDTTHLSMYVSGIKGAVRPELEWIQR